MDYKLVYLAKRNPSVAIADWPRTWRSHAKFSSQFPVLGERISRLLYCARVDAPAPGVSDAWDGAGVVASPFAESLGGGLRPKDEARIFADEDRVFGSRTPLSALRCRETLVEGGAPGNSAVLRFLARRPDVTEVDFHARWHAWRGDRSIPGTIRHVHNARTEPSPTAFDGIGETWFGTVEQAAAFLASPAAATIDTELAAFADPSRGLTLVTHVIYRWPREG